ncbi:MAG TPA: L-threonylcarbamoyladenylate synthase [Longimicrobiaceae bacterium]|nr:L-threonylcarbamoyladenylate synthase [Longimicrobiaceae bacterium]
MNVLRVDPTRPDPKAVTAAVEVLRGGGLVAFPTETVYGLGAHALDADAVARIYQAKGRPAYNPLIVHLASTRDARRLASAWPAAADRLAERFWPGPLTLVVPRLRVVPDLVSAGLPTVALRVPAHPVARALLEAAGFPIAAPSANRSTQVSPTTAEHVRRSLGDRIDLILDGGHCPVGIESTVLSLAGDVPTLLRPGTISLEEIREVIGDVALPADEPSGTASRPSPGMMDRHYAPRAELRLFAPEERNNWFARAREENEGWPVGVIAFEPVPAGLVSVVGMPDDAREYAARLYAALHELDGRGCRVIYAEAVPKGVEWAGVRDRLRRAATAFD